jgi:hypothetical protein
MSTDRDKVIELFGESTGEKFLVYADAHEGGDIKAAINSLLFCHKVLFAQLMREAKENDKARDQDGNKH